MSKLFPAQLIIHGLTSHLQTIYSSYYTWSLNVHCYSWQCNFLLAAITAELQMYGRHSLVYGAVFSRQQEHSWCVSMTFAFAFTLHLLIKWNISLHMIFVNFLTC